MPEELFSQSNLERLKRQGDTRAAALAKAGQEVATLWTSRINMALASRDRDALRSALTSTQEVEAQQQYMDTNCGC